MEKFKILYIHGLDSSKESSTVKNLRKYLDEDKFDIHAIDFSNEVGKFSNEELNITRAFNYAKNNYIDLIIGSSMGGFTALATSDFPLLLINPCMKPSEALYNLIYNKITPAEIEKYEAKEKKMYDKVISNDKRVMTYAIFGKRDELFSYEDLFKEKFRKDNCISINAYHRLSEENIKNDLIPFLKKIIKNVSDDYRLYEQQDKYSIFDTMFEKYEIDILSEGKSLLNERFLTAIEKQDIRQYAEEVWKLLEYSYSAIGGTRLIASSIEDFIATTDILKMVRRNNKIVACATYKTKRGGRKMVSAGCDGTPIGKTALFSIMKEDVKMLQREQWAEVSHSMEHIFLNKLNALPIPNTIAKEILSDKEFIEMDKDGYHYVRLIGGLPMRKIMIGNYKN